MSTGAEHYREAEKWLAEAEAQDWYTDDPREVNFARTRLMAAQTHLMAAQTAAMVEAVRQGPRALIGVDWLDAIGAQRPQRGEAY